jgi:hypothetical protein
MLTCKAGACDFSSVDAARFVGADNLDTVNLLKGSIFEADL